MATIETLGCFTIHWVDHGREPSCAPDPRYPNGVDIDASNRNVPVCRTWLPYPAKRCGLYHVRCDNCGFSCLITTAGRPDDPRSLTVPCKLKVN